MIDAPRRANSRIVAEPSESARFTSEAAPPEAKSFAREATVALAGTPGPRTGESLSASEIAIVSALVEALIPPDVRARVGAGGIDTPQLLVDFMRGWRLEFRLALRASLRFLEYAPIIFQVKPKTARLPITPFTGLPLEDRERLCRKLNEAHSYHVRSLFKVLKTLVYGVFYAHPDVSRHVGYDAAANKAAAEAWARSLGR
jgi:hypothetical protein